MTIPLTKKLAVVTLYSYFPALFDQTISIACELVRKVNASVTTVLLRRKKKPSELIFSVYLFFLV